ncbi:hypothetical protein Bbelb_402910 [Branchiostoma belcheri]|nr:hypothetical protein Bbelb_402910 [Branchiostoma belcheri]
MPYHTRKSSKKSPPNEQKKRKFSSVSSQTDEELDGTKESENVSGSNTESDIKPILKKILEEIESLKCQAQKDALHIVNLAKASQHAQEEVIQLRKEVEKLSAEVKSFEEKQMTYEKEKMNAQLKQVQLEAHSRRENLIFHNIQEEDKENPKQTEKLITQVMKYDLKLQDEVVRQIRFQRVHRIGSTRIGENSRPRPIIAKFVWYKDRERVRQAAKNLRGSQIGISGMSEGGSYLC